MMKVLISVLLLQAFIPLVRGDEDKPKETPPEEQHHVRDLTEDNFYDVVLDTNVNVLVMFYSHVTVWSKQYVPTYKKVAEIFKDEPNCVVAFVDVNKYRQLMKIYEYGGMMKFWFFPADIRRDGEQYTGSRSLPNLVELLNEKCGTNRKVDGTLDTKKGRDEKFDSIAESFVEAITNNDNNDNSTTDNTLDTTTGAYYVHVMKKITEKGVGYLSEEMARLEKILAGYLKFEKRKEKNANLNILKYFSRLINKEEDPEEKVVEDLTESEAKEETKEDDNKTKEGAAEDIVLGAILDGKDHGTISKDDLQKNKKEL